MAKFINDSFGSTQDLTQALADKLQQIDNLYSGDDETDMMFNMGMKVQIYHVPTRAEIAFKAFITDFEDSYDPDWNKERVFGRNDPHQVFSGTERIIALSWKVLASDINEARENMKKMSMLAQMQYPTYNSSVRGSNNVGVLNSNAIQASPIFKLKLLNWIQDVSAGQSPVATAKESGLVGIMRGFKFKPELDMGVFHDYDGSIYPQELTVNLTYEVLHTHALGFKGRESRQKNFPYGENLEESNRRGRAPGFHFSERSVRNSLSGKTAQQQEAKQSEILEGGE